MKIIHDTAQKAFLLVNDDDKVIGEITYTEKDPHTLYAPHTAVNPAYVGQGCAMQLLEALAEYARGRNARIIPICSYVVNAFRKHPEKFADVIK